MRLDRILLVRLRSSVYKYTVDICNTSQRTHFYLPFVLPIVLSNVDFVACRTAKAVPPIS